MEADDISHVPEPAPAAAIDTLVSHPRVIARQ